MCEVAHRDLALLFNACEEGPFVVDFEREDAVLVGRGEDGAEDRAVGRARCRGERDAVER